MCLGDIKYRKNKLYKRIANDITINDRKYANYSYYLSFLHNLMCILIL